MGYITNQFVNKGEGLRSRTHRPVQVNVEAKALKRRAFLVGRELGEAVELNARQDSGAYQRVMLTELEAAGVAVAALSACGLKVRTAIAKAALATLSDDEAIALLAEDFGRRTARK